MWKILKNINSFNLFSSQKHVYKIQYLMSFLCGIVITDCKEVITFSSCISLLFRPATIIFMAKITFLSPPTFGEWENSRYFTTLPLVSREMTSEDRLQKFHTDDVSLSRSAWIVTRHQYGISELLLQPSFPGETNGSVWKCRPFCQATSFWGWLQSEPKPFLVSK